ncbi:Hypothetical protein FKW44_010872 [Caligus rogercresseyi]|uniref:Uncharacterized protein n=1 Tax=Caligus rogercresseyi TaxID=217165 RepID=A0A7T8K9C3_CALRO|nr:Hypothetical protein FKW44_010872 [Caligus rogercresseyi]
MQLVTSAAQDLAFPSASPNWTSPYPPILRPCFKNPLNAQPTWVTKKNLRRMITTLRIRMMETSSKLL